MSTQSSLGRELVFCASSTRCNTARMVEKGTVFYCHVHQDEAEEAGRTAAQIHPGTHVIAKDRHNHGVVLEVDGTTALVSFPAADRGTDIQVKMSIAWLEVA